MNLYWFDPLGIHAKYICVLIINVQGFLDCDLENRRKAASLCEKCWLERSMAGSFKSMLHWNNFQSSWSKNIRLALRHNLSTLLPQLIFQNYSGWLGTSTSCLWNNKNKIFASETVLLEEIMSPEKWAKAINAINKLPGNQWVILHRRLGWKYFWFKTSASLRGCFFSEVSVDVILFLNSFFF